MKRLSYFLVLFAFACSDKPNSKLATGKAHFQNFTYSGNEPYFTSNALHEGKFYNAILPGFYPDPSITQKGEDYYLVNSTFSFFPGVPIFHSTDLVNWTQIGHVLDRPSQLKLTNQHVSHGIFAPALRYNKHTDMFYMTTTLVSGGGNFMVTAKDPAGPWSDPIWFPEVPGIDPSLFFDDDGRAYLMNNHDPEESLYEGHKAVWLQELDLKTNKLIGPRQVIRNGGHNLAEKPIWIEGPHLYKIDGWYYLMTAEGGTSINHSEVVFRSKNVFGPYETNPNNPILTQRAQKADRDFPVTNVGHADMFQHSDSNWYAIFLACRPYTLRNDFNIGRETFILPVTWQDGWPVILAKDSLLPQQIDLPKGATIRTEKGVMPKGNFGYTDTFEGEKLGMDWMELRTPTDSAYAFDKVNGGIVLNARPVSIRDHKYPSFIARRQQHHNMEVETTMDFLPLQANEFAGLMLFQNEAYYLALGVALTDGKTVLQLQKGVGNRENPQKEILEELALPANFDGHLTLKVACESGRFTYFYKLEEAWIQLSTETDATYLSTEKAGGFIGTMIGLYASSAE